jgi:hypothetical protein
MISPVFDPSSVNQGSPSSAGGGMNKSKSLRPELKQKILSIIAALGKTCSVKWVTGSRSASIPSVVAQQALIPTGTLIKEYKIPPLCGVLDAGISDEGLNITQLSGARVANYETAIAFSQRNPSSSIENIIESSISFIKENKGFSNSKMIAMLRILHLTDDPSLRKIVKEEIDNLNTQSLNEDQKKDVNSLLPLFATPAMIPQLPAEKIELIEQSFPIIYATTKEQNYKEDRKCSLIYNFIETTVLGSIPLGKEGIDLIFTDEKNLQKVRNAFKKFPNILVQSTQALHIVNQIDSKYKPEFKFEMTKKDIQDQLRAKSYAFHYKNERAEEFKESIRRAK